MKIFFLIILLVIVGAACKDRYEAADIEVIKIALKNDKTIPLYTDSVFSEVDYVRLQTSDSSLISDITKLRIFHSHIYILDKNQEAIFIFDLAGKLIKKMHHYGRGAGEYVNIHDFTVDDKYLYIAARVPMGILRYDINTLQYVDHLASELDIGYRVICNDKYLFLYSGNIGGKSLKDIAVVDKNNGEVVGEYKNLDSKKSGWSTSEFIFAGHHNKIYGVLPYSYYIYLFDTEDYKPVMAVDFGAENMLPKRENIFSYEELKNYREKLPDPYDKPVYSLDNLSVTDKNICFTFIYLKHNNLAVYFPETKKLKYGRIDGTYTMPFTGQIACITDDNRVVLYYEAYWFSSSLKYIKENNKNFVVPESLLEVSPDDNPVLVIYKIKDNE